MRKKQHKHPISTVLLSSLLFWASTALNAQTVPQIKQQAEQSVCTNIVALTGSTINCAAPTIEQQRILKSIPVLLKKILDKQPDLAGLKNEMDQVFALVRAANPGAGEGLTISVDNKSNGNDFSDTRSYGGPLNIKVDNQSDQNTFKNSESIRDCVMPGAPHQIAKYKKVINESLRESVIEFSKSLREFASSAEQQEETERTLRSEHIRATVDFQSMSQDQAREVSHQLFIEDLEIDKKNEAELAAKIGEQFLGQATEYREELRWRLSKASLLPPETFVELARTFWPDPTGNPALDVRTLKQTASYLENLARQLP